MKIKLLTEAELRARWTCGRGETYVVDKGTILTPAAKDFVRENNITISTDHQKPVESTKMTTSAIPVDAGRAIFVDAATGERLNEKPEEKTHLRGNLLVSKTDPQIMFRGKIDSLMAQILEVQLVADETGVPDVAHDLDEILSYVHQILAAEVKNLPLQEICLLGIDNDGIRHQSHQVKEVFGIEHPIPNYKMGRLCVALNYLRTQIREAELAAATAFTDKSGACVRNDIAKGLNRLSSIVYIIFCRNLSGYYDGGTTS